MAGNLETIANFHASFYHELSAEYNRGASIPSANPNLAKVFSSFASFFKLYTAYLNEYEACVVQMEELRENDKFQAFVQAFMQKSRRASATSNPSSSALSPTQSGSPNLSPMDYIITPVQRLPRYVLLLKELLKNTPPLDQPPIQQALTSMETIASFVNERKRSVENMNKLLEISQSISGELPPEVHLIEPHRKLIREGTLSIISSRSVMGVGLGSCRSTGCVVRLFTDLLLWTTNANKYKGYLDLNSAGVIASNQDDCCVQLSDAKTTIFARAGSAAEIASWSAQIQHTITTLHDEKESTRRRQRVAKARSTNHTHRSQLRTFIHDSLCQLSPTTGDTSNTERVMTEEYFVDALKADPQMQNEWLEKEVAAAKRRERTSGAMSAVAGTTSGTVGTLSVAMLPQKLIAQLKHQQFVMFQRDADRPSSVSGSASIATTASNSSASSRHTSRRTSFSSLETPSLSRQHSHTRLSHASTTSTDDESDAGSAR